MDVAGQVFAFVIGLGLLIAVPIMRQRAKENRIRREWRARGLGYAEGKHAVVPANPMPQAPLRPEPMPPSDPSVQVVPYKVHDATGFKWLSVGLLILVMGWIGAMLYQLDGHVSNSRGGVSLTTNVQAAGHKPDLARCGGTVESCLQELDCLTINQGRRPYFGGRVPPECRASVMRWTTARLKAKSGTGNPAGR